jgi:hypothetical protein
MPDQLTTNGDALRLFFTDDVYLVNEPIITWGLPPEPSAEPPVAQKVEPEISSVPPETKAKREFRFLGSNKRNILILVNDPDNEVSDEAGRDLLRKVLKSINLVSADFALLNYAKYSGVNFAELSEFFNSSLIFSFGVEPLHLGLINHPSNTIVFEGEVRLIFSHELKKLNADILVKKALWSILQTLAI